MKTKGCRSLYIWGMSALFSGLIHRKKDWMSLDDGKLAPPPPYPLFDNIYRENCKSKCLLVQCTMKMCSQFLNLRAPTNFSFLRSEQVSIQIFIHDKGHTVQNFLININQAYGYLFLMVFYFLWLFISHGYLSLHFCFLAQGCI